MPVIDFEDTFGNDPCIDIDINNKRDALSYYNDSTNLFRLTKDGYIFSSGGWEKRQVQVNIGDVAADSDDFVIPLLTTNVPITIENVEIATDTTVAASATLYQTINLYNSASSTAIATAMTTASSGFTLHVPRAFASISSTLGVIAAGKTLYMTFTKASTGTALSGVTVAISYTINIPEAQSGTATDNIIRVINGEAGSDGMVESDHLQRDHLRLRRNGETVFRIDVAGVMKPGPTYTPVDMYYMQVSNLGTIVSADSAAKKSALFKPNGTAKIVKVYMAADVAHAADSDTNYMQVLVKDNSGNVLVDGYIDGPQSETGLTAGIFQDMGDINDAYSTITSSETLQVEYLETGTATSIARLTMCVIYTYE